MDLEKAKKITGICEHICAENCERVEAIDWMLDRLEKFEQVAKLSDGVVGLEQGEITDWTEIMKGWDNG